MEFYIKITHKKQTTRVVCASHARTAELCEHFARIAESAKLVVDPRVYSYQGSLVRSAGEVRAAMRLLTLLA